MMNTIFEGDFLMNFPIIAVGSLSAFGTLKFSNFVEKFSDCTTVRNSTRCKCLILKVIII